MKEEEFLRIMFDKDKVIKPQMEQRKLQIIQLSSDKP